MIGTWRPRWLRTVGLLALGVVAALLSLSTTGSEAADRGPWDWRDGPIAVELLSEPNADGRIELLVDVDSSFTICARNVDARVTFTPAELASGVLTYHGPEDRPATGIDSTVDVELRRSDNVWSGTIRVRKQADPEVCFDDPPLSYDSGILDVSLQNAADPGGDDTASPVPRGTGWRVRHIAFGIRCDLTPCRVQGDVVVRLKGAQLPGTKARRLQMLALHGPRRFKLVVAGKTIRYDRGSIDQHEEVEPFLQWSAFAGLLVRSGPLLRPGKRTGVLTFRTNARKVRKRVTVRFVRTA